ncbi:protein of unknown function [Micropruina glycogenica]|uniref:Uncharacterized protein n=1 Tax=Micropruina glycogenica TaxID=75385 RepID=A0A2N9JNF7_9ACTN|nr:protein of unknown function [Micropruina glycogenica]
MADSAMATGVIPSQPSLREKYHMKTI